MQLVLGSLQFSDACLRLYGHPDLLAVAETIDGKDFTPFNEAVWIKQLGLGGSVAWHRDGWTHWDSPDLDEGTHGFNFMAQLYGCNAANGLWVVPGSHRQRKADIRAMVAAAGSERLPDAVPLICAPGDVVICNRQAIHGSFANTCEDVRVTINFGFHRRKSVLGVVSGGVHNAVAVYDEQRIRERSRVIMYAISARQQRFPDEKPYRYDPFAGQEGLDTGGENQPQELQLAGPWNLVDDGEMVAFESRRSARFSAHDECDPLPSRSSSWQVSSMNSFEQTDRRGTPMGAFDRAATSFQISSGV